MNVLRYTCNNTEQLGILVEKAMCDIVKIPFNTKRKYDNLSSEVVNDISETVGPLLKKMKLEHVGNLNTTYDFVNNENNNTVSVKTLMKGNRICPQNIGQCSLNRLSLKLGKNFDKVDTFKNYFMQNKMDMLRNYLVNCFCCDMTIIYKFDKGIVYVINKDNLNEIKFKNELSLSTSKLLGDWNESNTIYVNDLHLNEKRLSIGEIQIHKNRDCVKFRFNVDTLVEMIKSGYIENVSVDVYNLKTKYCFTVEKNTMAKKLCFQSFNYLGSKMKLLDFIKDTVCDYTNKSSYKEVTSFADICSGTGVVSFDVLKGGCNKILTNDIQNYAYVVSSVWSKNGMDIQKLKTIVDSLNDFLSKVRDCDLPNVENLDTGSYFIYSNYTEAGPDDRLYLTKMNGYKTDYIRKHINNLRENGDLNDKEYRLLLKLLLYAVSSVSNIASVYGAYLKKYKKVALKSLILNWSLVESLVDVDDIQHESYNSNISDLLNSKDFSDYEVVYMDPPYVANRSYHDNYHLLETISRYDNPKIKGKTGLRELVDTKSKFCSKRDAFEEFKIVLSKIRSRYIFISYSSESVVSKSDMMELLKSTGWDDVKCYEKQYQRFKSNKNSDEKQQKNIIEYIFCGTFNYLNEIKPIYC
jgi:adenine-specific DNA-methyltransferase